MGAPSREPGVVPRGSGSNRFAETHWRSIMRPVTLSCSRGPHRSAEYRTKSHFSSSKHKEEDRRRGCTYTQKPHPSASEDIGPWHRCYSFGSSASGRYSKPVTARVHALWSCGGDAISGISHEHVGREMLGTLQYNLRFSRLYLGEPHIVLCGPTHPAFKRRDVFPRLVASPALQRSMRDNPRFGGWECSLPKPRKRLMQGRPDSLVGTLPHPR